MTQIYRFVLATLGLFIACFTYAQTQPTLRDRNIELVVKGGLPSFLALDVLFSPDEHYAAVHGPGQAVIFDLVAQIELRRIPVKDGPFIGGIGTPLSSTNLAFASHDQKVYAVNGNKILACDLAGPAKCTAVVNDATGLSIAVSSDGLIAYLNGNKRPVIVRTQPAGQPTVLPETVRPADKEEFDWFFMQFYESSGHAKYLALAGEIERKSISKIANQKPRSNTYEEWHVSVFDIDTGTVVQNYVRAPLIVDSLAYSPRGDLRLCGKAMAYAERDDAPRLTFDISGSKFLSPSELAGLPGAASRDGCYAGEDALSFPTAQRAAAAGVAADELKRAWKSPKKHMMISAVESKDGQLSLLLTRLDKTKHTDMLAGSAAPVTGVEFVPQHPMISTRYLNTHLWNFVSSTLQELPWDNRFSADGKHAATFEINAAKEWELTITELTSGKQTKTGVHLSKAPRWFGVSADGSAVAIEKGTGLVVVRDGKVTELTCRTSRGTIGLKPAMDPGGRRLGAFCDRDNDDPSKNGYESYLVVWDLGSLAEKTIPVHSYNGFLAFPWNGSKVLVGKGFELEIVDTDASVKSKASTFSLAIKSAQVEFMEAATWRPDDKSAVLVTSDIESDTSRILELDLSGPNQTSTKPTRVIDRLRRIRAITSGQSGKLAVLTEDGVVSLYDSRGDPLVKLISAGLNEWAALTDTGLFDGSPGALRKIGYRFNNSDSPVISIERLFNELYYPGLLFQILQGTVPSLPPGIDISTYLEIPGLQLLLQQGEVRPQVVNGKAVLCFERESVYDAVARRFANPMFVEDDHVECPRRAILKVQDDPAARVKALESLASQKVVTPWDGERLRAPGGTVHIFTTAVGKYPPEAMLPEVPTAVQAVRRLRTMLSARGAGDKVRIWSQDSCGVELEDRGATKANILHCLDLLVQQTKPDDIVIVALAGHGGTTEDNELFYFYPSDYHSGAPVTAVSSADLAYRIRFLQARRFVLIVDACESGAAMEPLGAALKAKVNLAGILAAQAGNSKNSDGSIAEGALLLAASSGLETAASSPDNNPFLDRVIDILSTAQSGDGFSWSHAIKDTMKQPYSVKLGSSGSPYTLHTVAISIGADFPITRGQRR